MFQISQTDTPRNVSNSEQKLTQFTQIYRISAYKTSACDVTVNVEKGEDS